MSTAKAWVSFAGAILTAVSAAFADDIFGAEDAQQVVLTVVSALFTLAATWRVPNKGSEIDA